MAKKGKKKTDAKRPPATGTFEDVMNLIGEVGGELRFTSLQAGAPPILEPLSVKDTLGDAFARPRPDHYNDAVLAIRGIIIQRFARTAARWEAVTYLPEDIYGNSRRMVRAAEPMVMSAAQQLQSPGDVIVVIETLSERCHRLMQEFGPTGRRGGIGVGSANRATLRRLATKYGFQWAGG